MKWCPKIDEKGIQGNEMKSARNKLTDYNITGSKRKRKNGEIQRNLIQKRTKFKRATLQPDET